jgi:hypothetical protein
MQIIDASDLLEEESEVILFGEARELGHVVQSNIDHSLTLACFSIVKNCWATSE